MSFIAASAALVNLRYNWGAKAEKSNRLSRLQTFYTAGFGLLFGKDPPMSIQEIRSFSKTWYWGVR
jgi:hypothetical protein